MEPRPRPENEASLGSISAGENSSSRRSIVVVDFVGFTAKNTEYEILAGIAGASVLITVIGDFVKTVMSELGIPTEAHDVLDPKFPVLKYTGDGLILSFASAQLAVDFAVKLQERSESHNLAQEKLTSHDKDLGYRAFRVGIATGEVLRVRLSTMRHEDLAGSVIGDAARLEAACQPGAVLISEATYQQLKNSVGFSVAFQVDGKRSDNKRYTVHQRVVAERAREFAGKIPYWRIHATTASVVARIERRIRYQMPPLRGDWALKLASALGVEANAEALLKATESDPNKHDAVLRKLGAFRGYDSNDARTWVSELALLATCRQIDFGRLAPPQPVPGKTKVNAYVLNLPTTLTVVASMCMAGLTGFSVRLEHTEALTIEATKGEPNTEYTVDALRQLYGQLYTEKPKPTWTKLYLEGAIQPKLKDALDEGRMLAVLLLAPEGDSAKWRAECEVLAESLDHLVALSVGDDLAGLPAEVHMGVLQHRLENILRQQLFDGGRP